MLKRIINQSVLSESSWIIVVLCLITSAGRFVMDSYLSSIPFIGQDLGVSDHYVELTMTVYLLGFGMSQLVYGPLSDRYGRRSILIIGLSIFLVANTLCAFSSSFAGLVIARFVSGLGIGASGVLNRAIASDCFKGAAFSKVWSYTLTTVVIVLVAAPLIGSEVQAVFGWRANFILMTLYVLAVLFFVVLGLPETQLNRTCSGNIVNHAIKSYNTILKTTSFLKGAMCYTLVFSGLVAYFQISALLLTGKFGLSCREYGMTSFIIALSYMAGGIIVNRFVLKWGVQYLLKVGVAMVTMSGLWMLLWGQQTNLMSVLLPVSLYAVGARIVIPNAISSAFEELRHLGGSASGMMGCIQILGSAVVSFLMSFANAESSLSLGVLFFVLGMSSFCVIYIDSFSSIFSSIRIRRIGKI